jgi:hypothetical protein
MGRNAYFANFDCEKELAGMKVPSFPRKGADQEQIPRSKRTRRWNGHGKQVSLGPPDKL